MADDCNGNDSSLKPVTIRDVAESAGVSIGTVSRVLHGRPDVSQETRLRVKQQIQAYGYVRNRSARAPVKGHTALVGIVVPFAENGYFAAIIEGASQAMYERHGRLVLCSTRHQHEREVSVLNLFPAGDIDGTLLVTPTETLAELRQLSRYSSPIVVIDPSVPLEQDIPVVAVSNWAGGRVATEHLIQLGHTRIGLVTGYKDWCATTDRLAGYRSALVSAGLPFLPEYVRTGDFHYDGGYRVAQALLRLPRRPTAIFAMNDEMAVGAMRAARELGLTVPDDVSIVGFDDVEIASVTSPGLTTVGQPLQELGRLAVTLLFRQIEGQRVEANRVELSTRLIVRASTAPPYAG